jgi:tetratricopeptide (TPR) repeat protein
MAMKLLQSVCRSPSVDSIPSIATPSIIPSEVEIQPRADSVAHHLLRLGDRAHIAGRFGKALLNYKRALKIFESDRAADAECLVACLNKISQVCREQGLYHEAEFSARRAFDVGEERLREGDPLTVSALNNLGASYQAQEKYVKAEAAYVKALGVGTLGSHDEQPWGRSEPSG